MSSPLLKKIISAFYQRPDKRKRYRGQRQSASMAWQGILRLYSASVPRRRSAFAPRRGFTIMEILVAIAVFVLATFTIAIFITQSFKAQNFSLEQSDAINEARRGVETMVKELRETLPGDTGAYPIESANPQELIFYADYDRDAAIEKVRYWLDGSDFKKGVREASGVPLQYSGPEQIEIISRYVRNATTSIFTYRDSNYTELSTPADPTNVKLIHVYLKINVMPNRAPIDYELESDVSLRNLKENL